MGRRSIFGRGAIGRMLRSRHYVPYSLLVTVMLSVSLAGVLVTRRGLWPRSFLQQGTTTVVITQNAASTVTVRIEAEVLGAVRTPGTYALPGDARVRDLVASAGGLLDDADLTRVDLAARLSDGQQIYVPHVGEVVPALLGGKINLNLASAQDLHNATSISLTIARKIVAYHAAHGSFSAVSQLLLVPVSRTSYDRIKDLVSV